MSLIHNIADIRNNYSRQALDDASVAQHPMEQFNIWLNEAITAEAMEPTAMVLSTVNTEGKPSARVVLLKDVSDAGLTFFTNYESRKGSDLEVNPVAAATFFWPVLERQVRVEGSVEKVPDTISDTYFHSRPKGSQIGAWVSPQSREIPGRQYLEEADAHYTKQFSSLQEIPRPKHWGGYLLKPDHIEFWQGRPNRLHDRILYEAEQNEWHIKRLAP